MEQYSAMSKDELVQELKRTRELYDIERKRSAGLQDELKKAKEQNLVVQAMVEQEEEYITNKLMKRLEQLKREKQVLANEVEQEEEFLTNTLQKKLDRLMKEKVDLENRLEAEQEYVVNKLQKQLEQLALEKNKLHKEKVDLENQLEAEQEYILNKLQKQVDKMNGEKLSLQREKSDLQRQVSDLAASVDRLNRDKVSLEQAMEMEEENIVNRLQRQLEAATNNYKLLEGKLEAKGMTLRDVGIQPGEIQQPELWIYSRVPSRGTSRSNSRDLGAHMLGLRRDRPLSASSSGSLQPEVLLAK